MWVSAAELAHRAKKTPSAGISLGNTEESPPNASQQNACLVAF